MPTPQPENEASLTLNPNKWFPGQRRRPGARLQLFCFSFAGGGASAFRGWQDQLPPWVEVWPLEYPGRETRFRDPAFDNAASLASAICTQLAAVIDLPFAFFGHSMGALLAFETARSLRRQSLLQPVELFVSGHGAPHLPPFRPPVRHLPEGQFREELRLYGGTPEEVLANDELMQFLSPLLRTDLGVCETYRYGIEPELSFPITALGGTEDRTVPCHRLVEWSYQTTGQFRAYIIPGDHFFVRAAAPLVWKLLARHLEHGEKLSQITVPAAKELHLWRIDLEVADERVLPLRGVLSPDEIQQADAFVHAADRTRYTVTRAALRTLLGRYDNVPPEKVQFTYSPLGKPRVDMLLPLEFNVAHSGGLALIAVACGQAVGVDVERIRTGLDLHETGKQVFTSAELSALAAQAPEQQTKAFFDLWSRKEAYLKCTGDGFFGSPEKIHIGLPFCADAGSFGGKDDATAPARLVQSFSARHDYAAAVAVEKGWDWMSIFNWSMDEVSES